MAFKGYISQLQHSKDKDGFFTDRSNTFPLLVFVLNFVCLCVFFFVRHLHFG